MLTKGDKTCHWAIKKKDEAIGNETVLDTSPSNSVSNLSTVRLLRRNFKRKMALLKKHSLVQ
jgi:hypothetical protein